MPELGKLEKIEDLRKIWRNEARDFTRWLSKEENLAALSKEIGIDIELEERESSVGSLSVDLFATEEGTGRRVIIENQLEVTDHNHLGKIITYAAGKDASVIIWIVKSAKDEYRRAVEWLNQHTDESIGFFLVVIELWKIDNSLIAPKFNVVESPNTWAKASKDLSDVKRTYVEYWEAFKEYAFKMSEMRDAFTARKPGPHLWYHMAVGKRHCQISLVATLTQKRRGAWLYISGHKEIYRKFKDHKKEIEKYAGEPLKWHEADQDSKFGWEIPDTDFDESNWNEYFAWYCDRALKLKEIVKKFG